MTTPEFCALYVHARNLLQRNGLKRILADHRRMPAASEAQKEWLLHEWLPKTIDETGYERCAVLRSEHPMRLHTADVVTELERFIELQFFDDVLAAAAWLRAK